MNVLFLDIDGVVNCKTTPQRFNGFLGIDPFLAFLIGKILIEVPSLKIVLSSSWRHSKDSVEEIERRIAPIFDVIPTIPSAVRGEEIKEWLSKNSVKKYAIIDDNSDFLEEQLPHFFKTEFEVGITEEIVRKIIEHFNQKPPI